MAQTLTRPNNKSLTQSFKEKRDLLTQIDSKRITNLLAPLIPIYDSSSAITKFPCPLAHSLPHLHLKLDLKHDLIMQMNLREQLEELLPKLLPTSPTEAIKGTELIRLVRQKLGEGYSDASLRHHFSLIAAEPESKIAKVERGQGYYRRTHSNTSGQTRGILPIFLGENNSGTNNTRAKALAIAVRYYDTSGHGVFVFSNSEEGNSWLQPDLAIVEWPEGDWDGKSLIFDKEALKRRQMLGNAQIKVRSACLSYSRDLEEVRKDFFRTLATSSWAQTSELILVGELPDELICHELRDLAAKYGVSIKCLDIPGPCLNKLPNAEEIFKAEDQDCINILSELSPIHLAVGQRKNNILSTEELMTGEVQALFNWLSTCLEKGCVEEYEFRVSCY